MNTDILNSTQVQKITIASDFDSAVQILTISMIIPDERDRTYSIVKEAILAMQYAIDITWIESQNSAYDCTGKWFSTGLKVLDRSINGNVFTTVLKHYTSVDC